MPTRRVFVCRCEDVTLEEIDEAVALGLSRVEELKRYTGLGTGPCQGKECLPVLCAHLLARNVIDPELVEPFTARPPTEPVTLGALASAGPRDDEGHDDASEAP
jgi:bacterioferritin-associated ferredoxin